MALSIASGKIPRQHSSARAGRLRPNWRKDVHRDKDLRSAANPPRAAAPGAARTRRQVWRDEGERGREGKTTADPLGVPRRNEATPFS